MMTVFAHSDGNGSRSKRHYATLCAGLKSEWQRPQSDKAKMTKELRNEDVGNTTTNSYIFAY